MKLLHGKELSSHLRRKYRRAAYAYWGLLVLISYALYWRPWNRAEIWIAVEGDTFIGGLILAKRFTFVPSGLRNDYRRLRQEYPNLQNGALFVIDHNLRRKGYGSQFIQGLKRLYGGEGCWFTTVVSNIDFYQKNGCIVFAIESDIPQYRWWVYQVKSLFGLRTIKEPEKLVLMLTKDAKAIT